MICNFIIAIALILSTFIILGILMKAQPFAINLVSLTRPFRLFLPSSVINTKGLCNLLQYLTLIIPLLGLGMCYFIVKFKKSNRITLGTFLEKYIVISFAICSISFLAIYFYGDKLISRVEQVVSECAKFDTNQPSTDPKITLEICKDYCWLIDDESKELESFCTEWKGDIIGNNNKKTTIKPRPRLIAFCITGIVVMSLLMFYSRKVLINYRDALEIFQMFLKDFKETPRSKLVNKYLVDDPIIEDNDEDQ